MQRILFELKTIRKTFPLLLIFYRKKKFPTIFIYISQEFNLSMQPFLSSSFFDFLKSFILFYYLYIRPIYVYICICVWWNRYLPRCFPSVIEKKKIYFIHQCQTLSGLLLSKPEYHLRCHNIILLLMKFIMWCICMAAVYVLLLTLYSLKLPRPYVPWYRL